MWASIVSNFHYHKMLNSELENTFALSGHSARCCRTLLTNSLEVQPQMKDTIHTTWFQAIWSVDVGLFLFIYLFLLRCSHFTLQMRKGSLVIVPFDVSKYVSNQCISFEFYLFFLKLHSEKIIVIV